MHRLHALQPLHESGRVARRPVAVAQLAALQGVVPLQRVSEERRLRAMRPRGTRLVASPRVHPALVVDDDAVAGGHARRDKDDVHLAAGSASSSRASYAARTPSSVASRCGSGRLGSFGCAAASGWAWGDTASRSGNARSCRLQDRGRWPQSRSRP